MTFSSNVITEITSTVSVGTTTTGNAGTSASVVNVGTAKDSILSFTIPRGATGAIGATGATGAPGQDGLSSSVFIYTFSDQTTGTPTNGHLFLNNTDVSLSTILNVSHIDKTPGHDIDQLLNTVNIGSKIIIQHSTDSNIYINYYITSKTINTGYVSYGITYDSKLGSINNNREVIIIIQMAGIAGPAGATGATGATGAQGPSSSVFDYKLDRINFNTTSMTSGTIRFNNADITLATEIYVHYLNEFGLDWQRMISLFPTHSTIIIQDKATANYILYDIPNLIVRTANQFITIPVQVRQNINASALTNNLSVYLSNQSGTVGLDGAPGATGATGAPGANGTGAGYPFNPIDRMTTTITTGNKPYMYVVMHPQATTINGFHVYITTGADSIHVGIYRGALRSGNSGNIVLCGESVPGVATTTAQTGGLPNFLFCRRAITAVSGQNLNFTSGELMTIAFHSNGTTNGYLCSPALGTANQDLAWSMNANYGSTAFPSVIGQSAIQSANLQRLCFELY